MRLFTIAGVVSVAALGWAGAVQAQASVRTPDTTNVERAHFTGKIAGIDPASHRLVIDAETPKTGLGMTIPYDVGATGLARYHVGQRVTGDVVTSMHRTFVMNVRPLGERYRAINAAQGQTRLLKPEIERWNFVGRVAGIDAASGQLLIEAEKGGKGAAMTVPYVVPNKMELARYKVGDKVRGQIVVSRERTYVQNVRATAAG